MANNKSLIVAGVALAGLVGLAGITSAQASASDTLVDKLVGKFNLNKTEVQKVFEENRIEMRANHKKRYEERLNQAVKDGKLTTDQKDKILAKHKELVAKMEAEHDKRKAEKADLQDKTEVERKAFMEARKAEMVKLKAEIEDWEKANNIPSGYLLGFGHKGPGAHGLKHTRPM